MSAKLQEIVEKSKRPFGKTGLMTPALSFGAAGISGEGGGYGFGDISEQDAIELVRYAFELGINVFDTAPIYGFGLSEERLGKALKEVRERAFIISKSGVGWHENKRVNMSNDPKLTEAMLLDSLKRLQTEYIDLYFIHWPDQNVDIRKPLEVLSRYKEKEVIRHIGLCNTNLEDLEKAKEIDRVAIVQSEYNLFNRGVEQEVLPYCKENQIGFMSWGTLDKGILTGHYDLNRNFDDSDARKKSPWWKKSDVEKKVGLVDEAKKYQEGVSFTELATSFNLKNPDLTTILSGPKSKNQLDELIQCLGKSEEISKNFPHWNEVEQTLQKFHG